MHRPVAFADIGVDFLRLSRASIDDTITQNLNVLVMPSRAGFDPASTTQRGDRPLSPYINPQSCQQFREQVLFPAWQARSHVLSYCAAVAASPDPEDPAAVVREVETEKRRVRVVDERLDPYSSHFFPIELRTEKLASEIRQERGVERIVRTKTWATIKERCAESTDNWEQALSAWRKPNQT
jgi:hypothetical protein